MSVTKDESGSFSLSFNGHGEVSFTDPAFNSGMSGYGIAADGINLYIADSLNATIRKILISTSDVTTIAGVAGDRGSEDGTGAAASFNYPTGIATDGANIFAADSNNSFIRKIVKRQV